MIHKLKCWPKYYSRVFMVEKTFEIRLNDRDYQPGDILQLEEYDPETKSYTGSKILRTVGYILYGPGFGVEKDYCVMSLHILNHDK